MFYYTKYKSPIGLLTIISDENNIVSLQTENSKYPVNFGKAEIIEKDDVKVLKSAKEWLDKYFEGQDPSINEISLKPIGNEFRQLVWKLLCEIPYGKVVTYGDIAKKVAKIQNKEKMSAQAVGGAIGHNPIFIIIPCHRVVGANGNLTGYAGGIEVKRKLLDLESNISLKSSY